MNDADNVQPSRPTNIDTDYEAPAIEQVVTKNELEREVHYAGASSRIFG